MGVVGFLAALLASVEESAAVWPRSVPPPEPDPADARDEAAERTEADARASSALIMRALAALCSRAGARGIVALPVAELRTLISLAAFDTAASRAGEGASLSPLQRAPVVADNGGGGVVVGGGGRHSPAVSGGGASDGTAAGLRDTARGCLRALSGAIALGGSSLRPAATVTSDVTSMWGKPSSLSAPPAVTTLALLAPDLQMRGMEALVPKGRRRLPDGLEGAVVYLIGILLSPPRLAPTPSRPNHLQHHQHTAAASSSSSSSLCWRR